MYEPHFGLRTRPFASAPDPDFYFDSRGHQRALAYLRHGIAERDSFMVMTGEIGAGKTTLVHKLLREIDAKTIEVALLVSSQLDARELLGAAASAFGLAVSGTAAEELPSRLRQALAALAARGKRALLVVDEAQNLRPDAIDLLTEFAPPHGDGPFELQVLLVGQPELQERIGHRAAHAPRQTVFIHCHIAGLSEQETRDYVEHRLRHVGWNGVPAFAADAWPRLHAHTGGVPRRINRLCDRLLLAAYLGAHDGISARLVDRVDAELNDEFGEPHLRAAPHRDAQPALAPPVAPRTTTRPGPMAGRAIPTLHNFVTPPPAAALDPGAASAGPSGAAAAPALEPAAPAGEAMGPAPARARPRLEAVWAAALLGALVVMSAVWWLGQRRAQVELPDAAPSAGPALSAASAPVPATEAQRPAAPPAPSSPAVPAAPCTAAVIALGLCDAPSSSPPPSKE